MTEHLTVEPAKGPIVATVRPPGSKSQTIRALVAASLAHGRSKLDGALDSDDTRVATAGVEQLGARVETEGDAWTVEGTGGGLNPPESDVDAGASGLTARAMIAVGSLIDGEMTVVGRDRLPERPMGGLVQALNDMGVHAVSEGGHLPVTVRGTGGLPGGEIEVDSSQTSQFASALLLTAPLADRTLRVVPVGLSGSHRYLDVTLATMHAFGGHVVARSAGFDVEPTGYVAASHRIEPDASAAVYPLAAVAIVGGRVTIDGLGSASQQPDIEIVQVLEMMGCVVTQSQGKTTVESGGGSLLPLDVDMSRSPDGALVIAVVCLFANGKSRLRGLGSLRFKESDRLAAMATELSRLGAVASVDRDDLIVEPGTLRPGRVDTYGDHRIAMAFAIAGLRIPGLEIAEPGVVAKTWPGFWDMLSELIGTG
jgi:3-phosphoshikimate 1-carboxyvinyltransferase